MAGMLILPFHCLRIGSHRLNDCHFIRITGYHNYLQVFGQLTFVAKIVHELS